MRFNFTIFLFCLMFFSCEEQIGLQGDMSQEIADDSRQIFPGKIIEQSSDIIEDVAVWKVKIENESGSVVSFYWQKSYSLLFMIEGEKEPFNYELKPPIDVLVLTMAKFLAFESYSDAELQSWKLNRSQSHKNRWVYQFFLKGAESPKIIDAISGDVL